MLGAYHLDNVLEVTMKELMFMAQESNDEPPRQVTISKEKGNVTARCTCPRGGVGHICRHRLSILSGNGRLIVSDNVADVKHVEDWVVWSDVGVLIARLAEAQKRALEVLDVEVTEIQNAIDHIQR